MELIRTAAYFVMCRCNGHGYLYYKTYSYTVFCKSYGRFVVHEAQQKGDISKEEAMVVKDQIAASPLPEDAPLAQAISSLSEQMVHKAEDELFKEIPTPETIH